MRRFRSVLGLGIVIAAIGIGLRPTGVGVWLEDEFALPCLFTVRGPVEPPRNVVVVSIDKTSADQLGLRKDEWPPPRHIHARVIRSLSRHGVSAIIMDVFFKDQRTLAEDDDLAHAIAESGKVALFESVDRLRYNGSEIIQTRSPIPLFREAALATAVFPLPEGAHVRHFWTFFDATAGRVPTLPSVALQLHTLPHIGHLVSALQKGSGTLSDLPGRVATVDESRQMMTVLHRELGSHSDAATRTLRSLEQETEDGLTNEERSGLAALVRLYAGDDVRYLNFYGPPGTIRTIPFHKLLIDTENSKLDLRGAVVFIGEGAVQLPNADQRDTYRTVYSDNGVDLSGAEIGATAFANLLTSQTLRRLPFLAEIAVLSVFGVLAAFVTRRLPWFYAAGTVLALGGAYSAFGQYLFANHAVLVPLGIPVLVQIPLSLFAAVLSRYRRVRKQVAGEIEPGARPELVQGVCLSTDIENYVTASAGMDPSDLAALMGEYFDGISKLVTRRHGLMLGRAGDSAMCVWVAPPGDSAISRLLGMSASRESGERPSDVRARENACQAALEIEETVDRFNERHAIPLRTRIGLHVGKVALGDVGGEYHVVGDIPNTASRIEGLNRLLGTTILASDSVVRGLQDLCVRPVGRFELAGRPGELAIVEISDRSISSDQTTGELHERFAEALAVFATGNLAQAGELFQTLVDRYPSDGPARYYQRLCTGHSSIALSAGGPPVIRIESK